MQWVRRHRHRFILVFSLGAIAAMTYGFLKRIGMDPLSPSGSQESGVSPAITGGDCDPQPYDGPCELVSATAIQMDGRRALRARYRLLDAPRRVEVERIILGATSEAGAEPQMSCRGEWMAGPCPTGMFVFSSPSPEEPQESPSINERGRAVD